MQIMSQIGASLAASLAGQQQAQRVQSRDQTKTERKSPRPNRPADEVEVDRVEAAEAVRKLTDNGSEQTRDDRKAHDGYRPHGRSDDHPSIDVSA